jgi:cardiolipin-specific phospholipase
MGASSRPENFDAENISAEDTINYFIEHLERWRIGMDNLTDFYLAGHSLGGYIVGCYALKYHQHIKKLLLLSPIGIMDSS